MKTYLILASLCFPTYCLGSSWHWYWYSFSNVSSKDFIQSPRRWCPRFQGRSASCEMHSKRGDLCRIRSIRQVFHRKMTFIFQDYLKFYTAWESKKRHIFHVLKGKETSSAENSRYIHSSFHFLILPVSAVLLTSFVLVPSFRFSFSLY